MGFEGSPFHSHELSIGPLMSATENGLPLAMKLKVTKNTGPLLDVALHVRSMQFIW
jgi:hypothetical protein